MCQTRGLALQYYNMANQQGFISKIRLVYAVMLIGAILLVMFAFRWQVVEAEKFSLEADGRSKESFIPAVRGSIYAADGTTLAYSEPRYDVYVWIPELIFREQKNIQTREEFTSKIGPLIDKTGEQLKQELDDVYKNGVRSIKIADAVTVEVRQKIIDLTVDADKDLPANNRRHITGYELVETSKRIYPENQLASQVLGLTKELDTGKTIGLGGLEAEWEELEPLEGIISGERDAHGNAIGISAEKTIGAQRGNSIYTSIDKKVQAVVEEKLKWGVEAYSAKSGSVVVMDPKTGTVIAMANYPTYDPNLREATDPAVYGNKAVSEPFEIGSIGKIFTMAAAIDMAAVTPNSVILQGHQGCEKIHEELEPVCTHDKLPQPPMPIKDAFALSDNIYFLHLAQLMDKQGFYDYLNEFGIGHSSGVDIKGESTGALLKEPVKWNVGDQAAYSYGHSYQVNLLQATSAIGAIANRGILMQPHAVTKVKRADGTEISLQPRAIRRIVSESTAQQMDEMMFQIYQNNIFWSERHYADLKNYKIAMKSGTAVIPLANGLGYSNDINATYAGYDASPDHTFVMLVRLERPVGALASMNSRIVWLEIFRSIKDYLGVRRIGE